VVVSGASPGSDAATVDLYELATAGWVRATAWRGHIGKGGWTVHHVEGDLRTPIGTFTLSDAGGRRPDPGSGLPYYRSAAFTPAPMQPGFGDSRADVFDYLIAVDYNRVPGHSPLDSARPLGAGRGGGIWIHVDHGGPTHGCVSIPLADVRYLLRHLSAAAHPVVVMGDAARLAR
jgi:L,D-peptidoglycan transpeptidase YkuD (ErfK/YbiS/YcfS/YnhG family)